MFTTKKVRAAAIAFAAVGAVLASGGIALASRTGTDVSPWTPTHGHVAIADAAGVGKVTVQPFLVTKKMDKATATLF